MLGQDHVEPEDCVIDELSIYDLIATENKADPKCSNIPVPSNSPDSASQVHKICCTC